MSEVKWNKKVSNFFKKLWDASFGRLSDLQLKRINAAFGSFLMVVLMGFGSLVVFWSVAFHPIYIAFLVGSWEAFAVFIGVLIITIWGTTKTLPIDEQKIAKMVLTVVEDKISEAMSNMDENVADAIQNTLNSIANGYVKTAEVAKDIKENVEDLVDTVEEADAAIKAKSEAMSETTTVIPIPTEKELVVLKEAIAELEKGENAEIIPEGGEML